MLILSLQAHDGFMEELPLSGRLLAATPQLGDPNFRRTVVLIVEDDPDEGTLGVVLNRPTEVPLDQVLEPWTPLASGPQVVFRGGPISPSSALALALVQGSDEPVGWRSLDGTPLMSRIGLVDLGAPPELLAGGITSMRVFAGYAGWGAGQLRDEIADGAWFLLPGIRPMRSPPTRPGCGRPCCGGRAATWPWWPRSRMTRPGTSRPDAVFHRYRVAGSDVTVMTGQPGAAPAAVRGGRKLGHREHRSHAWH